MKQREARSAPKPQPAALPAAYIELVLKKLVLQTFDSYRESAPAKEKDFKSYLTNVLRRQCFRACGISDSYQGTASAVPLGFAKDVRFSA